MKFNPGAVIFFAVCSLAISLAFFAEGFQSRYRGLVTDQINFLTIAACADNAGQFKGDMVAGYPDSPGYYIPAFIKLVKWASAWDRDYSQGLNWLLLLTNLIYFWGWWMLFSIWGDRWIAAFLVFLARAVVPLPGAEIWGIAGLWTMLPRTLFIACLPWTLWLWLRDAGFRWGWMTACLLAGLLVSIHPLSGFCLIVALLGGEAGRRSALGEGLGKIGRRLAVGAGSAAVGLIPVLPVALSFVHACPEVDPASFQAALMLRFPPDVLDPVQHLKQWSNPLLLGFIFLPWVFSYIALAREWQTQRARIVALGIFSLSCVAVGLLPGISQRLLFGAGDSIPATFNLVRATKYVIAPAWLMWAFLFTGWSRRLIVWRPSARVLVKSFSVLVLVATLALRASPISETTVFRASPLRYLWPECIGPKLPPANAGQNDAIEGVVQWIRANTPVNATFVGPPIIRVTTLRAVVHDVKGASMLVERNPQAFVAWSKREKAQQELVKRDKSLLPILYRSWGADYWVTTQRVERTPICYQDARWTVYDLRPSQ